MCVFGAGGKNANPQADRGSAFEDCQADLHVTSLLPLGEHPCFPRRHSWCFAFNLDIALLGVISMNFVWTSHGISKRRAMTRIC